MLNSNFISGEVEPVFTFTSRDVGKPFKLGIRTLSGQDTWRTYYALLRAYDKTFALFQYITLTHATDTIRIEPHQVADHEAIIEAIV